jgi:hypothetical protein
MYIRVQGSGGVPVDFRVTVGNFYKRSVCITMGGHKS